MIFCDVPTYAYQKPRLRNDKLSFTVIHHVQRRCRRPVAVGPTFMTLVCNWVNVPLITPQQLK